jgi:hypothetical protein
MRRMGELNNYSGRAVVRNTYISTYRILANFEVRWVVAYFLIFRLNARHRRNFERNCGLWV